jgi:hypothetical protein
MLLRQERGMGRLYDQRVDCLCVKAGEGGVVFRWSDAVPLVKKSKVILLSVTMS